MVFEKVRTMLAACLGCEEDRIKEKTIILEDLEASPEDLEELFMGVEEEFGVTMPEDAIGRIRTVGQLAHFIEDQL